MSKLTSSQIAKTLATGLVFTALAFSTSVSAAGSRILSEANTDFDNTYSVSDVESTYASDSSQPSVLKLNKYDYEPRRADLEEAEFAAFEVPDALIVSD